METTQRLDTLHDPHDRILIGAKVSYAWETYRRGDCIEGPEWLFLGHCKTMLGDEWVSMYNPIRDEIKYVDLGPKARLVKGRLS
jgi:hypothetical protein